MVAPLPGSALPDAYPAASKGSLTGHVSSTLPGAHYATGTVHSTLHELTSLIVTTLNIKYQYFPHFTGEETEAQRGSATCLKPHSLPFSTIFPGGREWSQG